MLDLGTPLVYALTPRHLDDKIPALTPGFGRADATDGTQFPISFLSLPPTGPRWAAMQYRRTTVLRRAPGVPLATIRLDANPLSVFERICVQEGYECRSFVVPAPGVEMASQVTDIRRMQPRWCPPLWEVPLGVDQGV
jgi:branched-chain amino acid transport system substrate-binding protein